MKSGCGGSRRVRRWRWFAIGLGLVILGAAAIVLGSLGYVGSAGAHPGNTCNPPAGHGTPGCHVDATTTTAKTTTTTAKPTTTTAKATPTTAKTSTPTTKSSKGTTGTTAAQSPTTSVSGEGTADTSATGTSATEATRTSDVTATTEVPTTEPVSTTEVVPTTTSTSAATPIPAADASGPVAYVDQNGCLKCHSNPSMSLTRPDGTKVSLFVDQAHLPTSVHRFLDCTTCHGANPHETQSLLTKQTLAEKCGSCHQYELGQYLSSIHGTQVAKGNADAATCTDCHSDDSNPHDIVRVLDPSASTYPKNVAQTCAKCHNDPKLMGKYGIVEKVYETYMNTFHGKAMKLASDKTALQLLNTATCVSCHGSHDIKAVTDPSSPVAGMDNLAKTCEQCHPGAGAEFAKGFLGHKAADPSSNPQVFWGEKFFYVFTRTVLAGGVVLVAMPLGRWGVGKVARRRKSSKKNKED